MRKFTMLLVMFVLTAFTLQAQDFTYPDTWGKPGFNLVSAQPNRVQVVFSLPEFSMQDLTVKGNVMKNITVPGTFLFNDEGMPNLPGKGEYIAIPQGATPKLKIISLRTDLIHNVEIAPAPRIPLDNDRNPLDYTPNHAGLFQKCILSRISCTNVGGYENPWCRCGNDRGYTFPV